MNIPTMDALLLTCLFAGSAIVHLSGPRALCALYRRWRFRADTNKVVGVLQLAAAFFLSNPATRIWGVLLGGLIAFATAATLLNNGKYVYFVPATILLLALAPATLAGPF